MNTFSLKNENCSYIKRLATLNSYIEWEGELVHFEFA